MAHTWSAISDWCTGSSLSFVSAAAVQCGSVLGNAQWFDGSDERHSPQAPDLLVEFQGMAPDAKLVFAGAGRGGNTVRLDCVNKADGFLQLPGLENINLERVLKSAYDLGARIHSNRSAVLVVTKSHSLLRQLGRD